MNIQLSKRLVDGAHKLSYCITWLSEGTFQIYNVMYIILLSSSGLQQIILNKVIQLIVRPLMIFKTIYLLILILHMNLHSYFGKFIFLLNIRKYIYEELLLHLC